MLKLNLNAFFNNNVKFPYNFKVIFHRIETDKDQFIPIKELSEYKVTSIQLPKVEINKDNSLFLGNTRIVYPVYNWASRKLNITFEETDNYEVNSTLSNMLNNDMDYTRPSYKHYAIQIFEYNDTFTTESSRYYICNLVSFDEPKFTRTGNAQQLTINATFNVLSEFNSHEVKSYFEPKSFTKTYTKKAEIIQNEDLIGKNFGLYSSDNFDISIKNDSENNSPNTTTNVTTSNLAYKVVKTNDENVTYVDISNDDRHSDKSSPFRQETAIPAKPKKIKANSEFVVELHRTASHGNYTADRSVSGFDKDGVGAFISGQQLVLSMDNLARNKISAAGKMSKTDGDFRQSIEVDGAVAIVKINDKYYERIVTGQKNVSYKELSNVDQSQLVEYTNDNFKSSKVLQDQKEAFVSGRRALDKDGKEINLKVDNSNNVQVFAMKYTQDQLEAFKKYGAELAKWYDFDDIEKSLKAQSHGQTKTKEESDNDKHYAFKTEGNDTTNADALKAIIEGYKAAKANQS